ncbi:hypothetical protein K7W03_01360 [Sphingobium sp. PNB]|uniref:DUF3303 family protein n=1 Tax=Sphingobium sp. PNB TaxID=863934 RepID=UPI001CA3B614|nr:DUF3303 family protein [Sphingobium sp. PNB]MCB4858234.1 hypothetical protein [Sphingobium sp. PNB]
MAQDSQSCGMVDKAMRFWMEANMRMYLQVQMEVEAANAAIKGGSMAEIIRGFTEAAKPEGIWFTALNGKRTMVAIFDLASPADIPALAEPFFVGLNASFEISPAMNMDDLQKGLSRL